MELVTIIFTALSTVFLWFCLVKWILHIFDKDIPDSIANKEVYVNETKNIMTMYVLLLVVHVYVESSIASSENSLIARVVLFATISVFSGVLGVLALWFKYLFHDPSATGFRKKWIFYKIKTLAALAFWIPAQSIVFSVLLLYGKITTTQLMYLLGYHASTIVIGGWLNLYCADKIGELRKKWRGDRRENVRMKGIQLCLSFFIGGKFIVGL